MQEVGIRAGLSAYPVIIGRDAYGRCLPEILDKLEPPSHLVIVSHPPILNLHYGSLVSGLNGDQRLITFMFPEGELNKNLDTLREGYEFLLRNKVERSAIILAFGGGVVGDLAGFLAASYLRGIRYIQLPTTLMAMVDSSIGGKVGVDLPRAKNVVGAFYHPQAVISDLRVLESLPLREIRNGMAEVAKYGFLYDSSLLEMGYSFQGIEDIGNIEEIVSRCAGLKGQVVGVDEFDTRGIRAILNYGHTFGHALESSTGYGVLHHGEATAIGMMMAARAAELAGIGDGGLYDLHRDVLKPLVEDLRLPGRFDLEATLRDMEIDKKRQGVIRFVLLKRINEPCLVDSLPRSVIETAMCNVIEDIFGD
jgi:3-dehydroquinate synthase